MDGLSFKFPEIEFENLEDNTKLSDDLDKIEEYLDRDLENLDTTLSRLKEIEGRIDCIREINK